jgi:hypothetical protein
MGSKTWSSSNGVAPAWVNVKVIYELDLKLRYRRFSKSKFNPFSSTSSIDIPSLKAVEGPTYLLCSFNFIGLLSPVLASPNYKPSDIFTETWWLSTYKPSLNSVSFKKSPKSTLAKVYNPVSKIYTKHKASLPVVACTIV